jgi:CMP-N-acetylneuraminic acid synthetase
MNGIAVIPARGGSKGIKNKNIIDIMGKPLIAYTIDPALKAKQDGMIDDVVVSTDSEKIAEIARSFGASVPCLRPAAISGDKAKTPDAVLHMVEYCQSQGMDMESVMLLQPTSPLRAYEDIQAAVELYDNNNADSLISCYLEETITDIIMYRRDGSRAVPLNAKHNKGVRRQEHEKLYIRNGAIYITAISYLKDNHRSISENPLMYEMPKSRSVNLDTKEDLKLLIAMMQS